MVLPLRKRQFTFSEFYLLVTLLVLLLVQTYVVERNAPRRVSYSELL